MRRTWIVAVMLLVVTSGINSLRAMQTFKQGVSFTENQGQWDDRALFMAKLPSGNVWFTNEGLVHEHATTECQYLLRMNFLGANTLPGVSGEKELVARYNYFLGNDSNKWRTDVPNYSAIFYQGVYDGIDIRFHDNAGRIQYDIAAQPYADLSQIKIHFDGADKLAIAEDGSLHIRCEWGELVQSAPYIYQDHDGIQKPVSGSFVLLDQSTVGFEVSKSYNNNLALVIDPNLTWSTYLGGSLADTAYDVAFSKDKRIVIVGATESTDFPTVSGYDNSDNTGIDVFVSRFNSNGDSLLSSTYIGGDSTDHAFSIALDTSNNIYIAGRTNSHNYPTASAYDNSYNGSQDIIVTKLNASASSLTFSTYIGGSGSDLAKCIALDPAEHIYLGGQSGSSDVPKVNSFDTTFSTLNGVSPYLVKLSSSGASIIYSTFLGGANSIDQLYCIAVDSAENLFVGGSTLSSDFPLVNAFDTVLFGQEGYIAKFDSSGDSLLYSSYIGGDSDNETVLSIAVDKNGNAYLAGATPDFFPIVKAFQPTFGGGARDQFIAKVNPAGDQLLSSSYFGGSKHDADAMGLFNSNLDLTLDNRGNLFTSTITLSDTFPTLNTYDSILNDSFDIIVAKFTIQTDSLIPRFVHYVGGTGHDVINALTLDGNGNMIVVGATASSNFPTVNAYDNSKDGNSDAYVFKMGCCIGIRGNVSGDVSETISVADVTVLVQYLFNNGAPPTCFEEADANGDGSVTIADNVRIVQYLFNGGPIPADCP